MSVHCLIAGLSCFLVFGCQTSRNKRSRISSNNPRSAIVFHSFDGTLARFLTDNPRGGFATRGEQHYFFAPNAADSKSVIEELGLSDSSSTLSIGQPKDWLALDVTAATTLPAVAKSLVGRRSAFDGPRCYSAVLYQVGYNNGIVNVSDDDFRFWAKSPIVEEVGADDLAPGDVVAIGYADSTEVVPAEHVAIFVTHHILFQKASSLAESPFELVTWNSFQNRYPSPSHFYKFFRQKKRFNEYVAAQSGLTDDIRRLFATVATVEDKVDNDLVLRQLSFSV